MDEEMRIGRRRGFAVVYLPRSCWFARTCRIVNGIWELAVLLELLIVMSAASLARELMGMGCRLIRTIRSRKRGRGSGEWGRVGGRRWTYIP